MAKGKKLESSQRGIAFSTVSAMEVSILILIVGAGTFKEKATHTETFSIRSLSLLIERYIGNIGVYVFAIGFVAAALSSMLAVPLGAGITVQSVFSAVEAEADGEAGKEDREDKAKASNSSRRNVGNDGTEAHLSDKADDDAKKEEEEEQETAAASLAGDEDSKKPLTGNTTANEGNAAKSLESLEEGRPANQHRELPRFVYWSIISLMVIIATVVISMDGRHNFYISVRY